MKNILIYCGSSRGHNEIYKNTAIEMGKLLAERNLRLIYGAGSVGLMGVLADTILAEGGEAIGFIPEFLEKWEVGHKNLTESHTTQTMHERKHKMAEISDAVIALPGGYGTLDELFEILTWRQLELHQMPIGLLNVNGYFDPLLKMIENMVLEGFLKEVNKNLLLVASTPAEMLDMLASYEAPEPDLKWLSKA